jgi:hypothetical protein
MSELFGSEAPMKVVADAAEVAAGTGLAPGAADPATVELGAGVTGDTPHAATTRAPSNAASLGPAGRWDASRDSSGGAARFRRTLAGRGCRRTGRGAGVRHGWTRRIRLDDPRAGDALTGEIRGGASQGSRGERVVQVAVSPALAVRTCPRGPLDARSRGGIRRWLQARARGPPRPRTRRPRTGRA